MNAINNFFHGVIRAGAFVRKEIIEILRQPRLLMTLVLGPFLILLIFGIGYRNQARALRTLFVISDNNTQMRKDIEQYATSLGDQLIFAGITNNEQDAINRLNRGEVDLVAVTPNNAYQTIRSSQQAVFVLYHHEIDPFQVDYVNYFGQAYIDEVNRRVLLAVAQRGQADAAKVKGDVKAARGNATQLRTALEAGDQVAAKQQSGELTNHVDAVTLAVGASMGMLGGVQQTLGDGNSSDSTDILALLGDARKNANSINQSTDQTGADKNQQLQRASQLETDLATLDERLAEFTDIDANVLVRPFKSETRSTTKVQPTALGFFAPAVVALLLQHLAITFAALSIVRERAVGTMELFRVSPLSAGETLFGKYLSYMIFGGVIAALLTLLMIYGLHIPMLGNWWLYSLVAAALLFTSLGFGFLISLISQTDSQAVQYTMIALLTSVFFSGFLISLDLIWRPVQVVSWAMPTTYGIILLRDIMLRGIAPGWLLLIGLTAIGVVLCALDWLLLRRLVDLGSVSSES